MHIDNRFRPKIRYWLPAAEVDKDDLRQELQMLSRQGFGGVEVVVLQTVPAEILRGSKGWGTKQWDSVLSVISEETDKLGMSMDVAVGPGWPIASPKIKSEDEDAAAHELTYGVTDVPEGADMILLPKSRKHPEYPAEPLAVFAYRENDAGELIMGSYVDLSSCIHDGTIQFSFEKAAKVFAFYCKPTGQTVNSGQTYVVDHLGKAGAKAVTDYWKELFEKYDFPSMECLFCDSMEYTAALDWTDGLEEEFRRRRGYDIKPFLPFIGLPNLFPENDIPGFRGDDHILAAQVNNDYLEVLTQLHIENHLQILNKFAHQHGKKLRYQVAYNKPFEADRCALAVDIPENEALGRAAVDYQKIMAAAAHIGKKERYSFECAAEFGNCYGQTTEDLFWWAQRSMMGGMNAQVLHGGSYSGAYPQGIWPGYDGFDRLISNNWNRTLSSSHFRRVMDEMAGRNAVMCGHAKIDCAVFRQSYVNDGIGGEFCLYPDNGALTKKGFSYEFLSDTLLEMAAEHIKDGCFDGGNTDYRALIIPETEYADKKMLKSVSILLDAGIPVVWQGQMPLYCRYLKEEEQDGFEPLLQKVTHDSRIIRTDSLENVPQLLKNAGISPRVEIDGREMLTAVRQGEDREYYILYSLNRVKPAEKDGTEMYQKDTIKPGYQPAEGKFWVKVSVAGTKNSMGIFHPVSGKIEPVPSQKEGGMLSVMLNMSETELLILTQIDEVCMDIAECGEIHPVIEQLTLYSFEPDTPDEQSYLRSGFVEEKYVCPFTELKPWRMLNPELEQFAGKGVYSGSFTVEKKGHEYILELPCVSDLFSVRVNQCEVHSDPVTKKADITKAVHNGKNNLEIVVVSNLFNRIFGDSFKQGELPVPYKPQDYGMWETEKKKLRIVERSVKF